MKWKFSRRHVKSGIDLLEEAVFLLKTVPLTVLAIYATGAVPFILALLYFWADMSRSPFASKYIAEASLGMAVFYLWLKCWQTVFAANLKAHLQGLPAPVYSLKGILHLIYSQLILQPYSLILLPLSALAVIPFGWVYAYYHNLLGTLDVVNRDLKADSKKAWKLAALWPTQNQVLILLIAFCSAVVLIDVAVVMLFIPQMLQTLFGIDTVFTMSPAILLNSTFLASAAGITFLCMNPLAIAVYSLRCFYGESIHSAADLRAELKSVTAASKSRVGVHSRIALFLSAGLLAGTSVFADSEKPAVPPERLNQSIERVIEQREYQWRIPRNEEDVSEQQSLLLEFFKGVQQTISRWTQPVRDLWTKFRKWLRRLFSRDSDPAPEDLPSASADEQMLITLLLLIAVAAILAVLIYRYYKKRATEEPLPVAAAAVIPDLNDENIAADLLPEEGWQRLAMELLERGELRLALRALYMASLASLAARGFIRIAKYKSNREYQRELAKRVREQHEVIDAFSENVTIFERSWYGMYDVDQNTVSQFEENHQRIRSIA